jgi:thioredoxin reductase
VGRQVWLPPSTPGARCCRTLVLEKAVPGGQIVFSAAIDNYPGFPDGISGYDFSQAFLKHAQRFGAEVRIGTGADGGRASER